MTIPTFHLTIASVGETRFDGEAISATLPGDAGEFTLLSHHEPIVTTLKEGKVTVKTPTRGEIPAETKEFQIQNGVLEYSGNHAVVLL